MGVNSRKRKLLRPAAEEWKRTRLHRQAQQVAAEQVEDVLGGGAADVLPAPAGTQVREAP